MPKVKIKKISAREILDSRGHPTVEVTVFTNLSEGTAAVPSGASTGEYEALELRDGTKRYFGKGVQKAIGNIRQKIAPRLIGQNVFLQKKIDSLLIQLDGTENKSKLGANALLGVSLACARAAAAAQKKPLYAYLHQLTGRKMELPRPFFNVLNGGRHADNDLSFQEFLIVPKLKTFSENLRVASEIYHALQKDLAKNYGKGATTVGDEGGFAPVKLKKTKEALDLLKKVIASAGYTKKVDLALDCAASELYDRGKYFVEGKKLTKENLLEFYFDLIKKYQLISVEDPFEQNDYESFAKLRKESQIQIVGDDLTVTNPERIEAAIREKSCNCLLLKVNQIGTLSEALEAANRAYRAGWKVMVSHRSGETEDTFIADLAVALGCGQIKAGAPCRGERTAKYNRLLGIEETFINLI